MRVFKLLLLSFVLLIAGVACSERDKPLTGLWEFAGSGEGADESYIHCFLNLQADGKYTLYIPDYFDYGTYKQDKEDKSIFKFTSYRKNPYYGTSFKMQVTGGGPDEKKVLLSLAGAVEQHPGFDTAVYDNVTEKLNESISLKRAAVQFRDTDPYSYNLNRWRIRPDHKESCKEISYRLTNFLRHMHALFEGQGKAESERVGYRFSPSPILFGSNGIASKSINRLPAYWVHTFYNEEQALQANDMISAIFDEKINFPKGTKRYDEMWSNLLGQMIAIATRKDFYCDRQDSTTAAR